VTASVWFVAPPIGDPLRYHWFPLVALEVRRLPEQSVALPDGVMVGVGFASIGTLSVLTFTHPLLSVVVS